MSIEGDIIGFFEGSIVEPFEQLAMRSADDALDEAIGTRDFERMIRTLLT